MRIGTCEACGATVRADAHYCSNCGRKIVEVVREPQPFGAAEARGWLLAIGGLAMLGALIFYPCEWLSGIWLLSWLVAILSKLLGSR